MFLDCDYEIFSHNSAFRDTGVYRDQSGRWASRQPYDITLQKLHANYNPYYTIR